MTPLGWAVLVVGAVIVGVVAQLIRGSSLPYRWVITSIAALVGAAGASEWLFSTTTPEYEGFAIWPAIIGGLVVGIAVDLIMQWFASTLEAPGQGHGAAIR